MIKVLKNLAFWVVLAIALGIFIGYAFPQIGTLSKFGIDYFIMILKWMVGPIIFLTIIAGIVGLESLKDLGSIGLKGFIYFEVVSTVALAVGIVIAYFLGGDKLAKSKAEPASESGNDKSDQEIK